MGSDNRLDYIVSALRRGFNTSQIAVGLGVTQSAVTQLVSEHDLEKLASGENRFADIDQAYDNLERKALQKLNTALDLHECSPVQLAMIASRLNGAKRRSLRESAQDNAGASLVQISIPKHLNVTVTVSANNEVVAVGEREINTLSLADVRSLATKNQKPMSTLIDKGNLFSLPQEVAQ